MGEAEALGDGAVERAEGRERASGYGEALLDVGPDGDVGRVVEEVVGLEVFDVGHAGEDRGARAEFICLSFVDSKGG